MNRKFGIGILIFCFSASSVGLGFADQVVETAPIVVQPSDNQALNDHMMDLDRRNRDEEFQINQLLNQYEQLAQATQNGGQSSGQNSDITKIDQTMRDYRDALYSRDRDRIMANEQASDKYHDLVSLTEDTNAITVHEDLVSRSGMLAEKYLMLSALKDEMTSLNEKLSNQDHGTLDGFEKLAKEQQDKIQMLTERLDEMDQKITALDATVAQKELEITQLRDNLTTAQNEAADKDATIREQTQKIAILENQPKTYPESVSTSVPTSVSTIIPSASAIPTAVSTVPVSQENTETLNLSPIIVNPPAEINMGSGTADLSEKDATIAQQQEEIKELKEHLRTVSVSTQGIMALTPIVVSPPAPVVKYERHVLPPVYVPASNHSLLQKDALIKQQQEQIDLLRNELENKITELKAHAPKNPIIRLQKIQIDQLNAQAQKLADRIARMQAETDQLKASADRLKNNHVANVRVVNTQLIAFKNKIAELRKDLKSKDDAIHWLNQVVSVTRTKAKYFQLTSQQDKETMLGVEKQIRSIKNDFAQHFKDYEQFEDAIMKLKSQVSALGVQLDQKQGVINLLQAKLDVRTSQQEAQARAVQEHEQTEKQLRLQLQGSEKQAEEYRQQELLEQQLRLQLQDRENQIAQMRADIRAMLQAQANKEIYHHRLDDRMKLAGELVGLQNEETSLLDEKSNLEEDQNAIFDRHFSNFENRMKGLEVSHNMQMMDLKSRLDELNQELAQKEQEATMLQTEMVNKIAEEKNQTVLAIQVQELNTQIQGNQQEIAALNAKLQNGSETADEAGALRQQLAAEQQKVDQLEAQLNDKVAQANQMTSMLGSYQQKLEIKNNDYNQELRKLLAFKNYQAKTDQEIAVLNARLQSKEAQVVRIRKNMYDLQESFSAKDTDLQAKDLSLSMEQEKAMNEKTKEYQDKIDDLQVTNDQQLAEIKGLKTQLALATQQLEGMPSSDEVEFLRTGLKKATSELQEKNEQLLKIKTNADEYVKEFKKQSSEFQSLKDQWQEAQDDLARKDDDLKYKDLALTRLKITSHKTENELKGQIMTLTEQLHAAKNGKMTVTVVPMPHYIPLLHGNKVQVLEAEISNDDQKIKDLEKQVNQLETFSGTGVAAQKLKQALDKIDQQGRIINVLAQKLQDYGHSVDLSAYTK